MNAIDKLIKKWRDDALKRSRSKMFPIANSAMGFDKCANELEEALKEKGIQVSACMHRGKWGEWDVNVDETGNAVLFLPEIMRRPQ